MANPLNLDPDELQHLELQEANEARNERDSHLAADMQYAEYNRLE